VKAKREYLTREPLLTGALFFNGGRTGKCNLLPEYPAHVEHRQLFVFYSWRYVVGQNKKLAPMKAVQPLRRSLDNIIAEDFSAPLPWKSR
jgi:hypothetical protein